MTDLTRWLEDNGLERLTDVLVRHEIDLDILSDLQDDDLRELGIPLGDRRRLARAIKASLKQAAEPEDTTDAQLSQHIALPAPGRRQLTVMFCDLVGSTELAVELDPEELSKHIRAFQSLCRAAVLRFGGFVARYMGDGVLVYFGYPLAHEDDPERAVRSGLEINDAISRLNAKRARTQDPVLAVRIGIATGLVVVGEFIGQGTSEELAVVGWTPNLAARLQAIAEPDQMVIAPETYRLLGSRFDCLDLGLHDLKGIPEAVRAWRIIGERAMETRFAAKRDAGLAGLVGREAELAQLEGAWARAVRGEGQIALIRGEAGIGKSRLCETLIARLTSQSACIVRCQCSPFHRTSAFHPLIEELRHSAGFARDEANSNRLVKVEALLELLGEGGQALLAPIATLLSVDVGGKHLAPALNASEQREEILSALVERLLRKAALHPVVLLLEDAHWLDPSSAEFVSRLIDASESGRLLVLVTARSEYAPIWADQARILKLSLDRLLPEQVEQMLGVIQGAERLSSAVLREIMQRADGVPLFIEELTRSVLESDPGSVSDGGRTETMSSPVTEIPASLHDSLMARLDRLETAKEVAQVAATIGREFSLAMLERLALFAKNALLEALERLIGADLIYPIETGPSRLYAFRHALVRDAAYESLLRRRRQDLHGRIGRALVAGRSLHRKAPEVVAQHFTAAGLAPEAIEHWLAASRLALKHSALSEAQSHVQNGFKCLSRLPESPARDRLELHLQCAQGLIAISTSGHASPAVERAFTRAQTLCRTVGGEPELFPALWGITAYRLVRGDINSNRQLSESLLEIADRSGDSTHRLVAHTSRTLSLYYAGDFEGARRHFEQARLLYDRNEHAQLAHSYAVDRKVLALQHGSWLTWKLGFPDRAARLEEELNAHARELDHPYSLAQALTSGASVYLLRREPERLLERAREGIELAETLGHPVWVDHGGFWIGWALAEQGQRKAGVEHIRCAMQTYRKNGTGSSLPKFLGMLADQLAALHETEEGLALIEQALAHIKRWGERCFEAETYRLKGKLLLLQPHPAHDLAEKCLREALEIARIQKAKAWELRAATTLCGLLAERERGREGYELLAPVYDWFREGFDTQDLIDARRLLDELGH